MTSGLRYRAVLFDLDGTLVDSYEALAESINHVRREHGLSDLNQTADHYLHRFSDLLRLVRDGAAA